jgi:hypothetical protein
VLLLFPIVTSAQTGTATIIGRVTDEAKAVLPGVTVTAASPALQLRSMVVVTDERGEYRLTPLPIGTYSVTYELPGFQTSRHADVRLTAGFTARLDVQLAVGTLQETVTVTGEAPLVDASSTAASTQLTRETLELLPTSRSSYHGVLIQTPSARMPANRVDVGGSRFADSPRFYAMGQLGDSWHSVENVIAMSPADNPSGNYVDYSSMEETVVNLGAHGADTPHRGLAMNALVKSGGNDFSGTAYWAFTGEKLESNNLTEELREQGIDDTNFVDLRDDLSVDLGGRIVRDKVWFYTAFRNRRQHDESQVCAKPDGSPCTQHNRSRFFTGKATVQLNKNNKIIGFTQPHWRNRTGGGSAAAAWETATKRLGFEGTWKGEWQSVPTNTLVLSVLAGNWWLRSGDYSPDITTAPPALDSFTGESWGSSSEIGNRNPQDRYQVRASAEWYKQQGATGSHSVKVGTDLFWARAERGAESRGEMGNYNLVFNNGVADRIVVFNNPVTPKQPMRLFYFYVQDRWALGPRLTLNLGINAHHQSATINPGDQCRVAADEPAHLLFPAECYQESSPPTWRNIGPRAHVSYDMTGRGTFLIKGGYARYFTPLLEDDLHIANFNTIGDGEYRWRDLNGNRDYETGEVNLDPIDGPDFLSVILRGGDPAYGFGHFNPNLKQRYHDELLLSIEQQLASNWGVRLSGIQSWAKNQWRISNPLRPFQAYNIPITNPDPGPDGVVGNADDPGVSYTYYDYPRELRGLAFQDSEYVNDDTANRDYTSIEVSLIRRYANRWQFRTSYSTTRKNEPFATSDNTSIAGLDPNREINSGFENFWEWSYRASASYLFGWGIMASANFDHRSGEPWHRTVQFRRSGASIPSFVMNVEKPGTRRADHLNMLDLRAEKRFEIGGNRRFNVRANLYNALNTNSPLGIQGRSGPRFGYVTSIPPGRILEWSVGYSF